jgi:uncharacterized protein YjbJ (UPF0337 family)
MTSLNNKLQADKNKVVGTIKEKAGKAVGNDRLEVKGEIQHSKGKIQGAVENIKDAVKSTLK